jgi:uncharacterized membrane protein
VWVDTLRGFVIVLMVIFHFCYDLRYFGYVDWQVPNGEYWWPFRYFILSVFIFTVGMSLSLAHAKRFFLRQFSRRAIQLLLAAIVVSIGSRALFPQSWIYFGILHFIFVTSCMSGVLVAIDLHHFGGH